MFIVCLLTIESQGSKWPHVRVFAELCFSHVDNSASSEMLSLSRASVIAQRSLYAARFFSAAAADKYLSISRP